MVNKQMKRDWDCIRVIFLALENKGDSAGGLRPNEIEGFDAELVSYNMKLLIEAGLIEGVLSGYRRLCLLYRQLYDMGRP